MSKDYHGQVHDKKVWPKYYEAIRDGSKTFELRKEDDCRYDIGDLLILREWTPITKTYTGYITVAVITYVLRGVEHLAPGYAALGIKVLQEVSE
jgi:ribosomal protein S17